jgi:hypothetical protein
MFVEPSRRNDGVLSQRRWKENHWFALSLIGKYVIKLPTKAFSPSGHHDNHLWCLHPTSNSILPSVIRKVGLCRS